MKGATAPGVNPRLYTEQVRSPFHPFFSRSCFSSTVYASSQLGTWVESRSLTTFISESSTGIRCFLPWPVSKPLLRSSVCSFRLEQKCYQVESTCLVRKWRSSQNHWSCRHLLNRRLFFQRDPKVRAETEVQATLPNHIRLKFSRLRFVLEGKVSPYFQFCLKICGWHTDTACNQHKLAAGCNIISLLLCRHQETRIRSCCSVSQKN